MPIVGPTDMGMADLKYHKKLAEMYLAFAGGSCKRICLLRTMSRARSTELPFLLPLLSNTMFLVLCYVFEVLT